jgi:glyceraldehyde 3-phosphate dehydrogenase
MNKVKIGINGFGRIGRLAARIILTKYANEMEIVGINDLTSPENLAYLFEFDSTYRRFEHSVLSTDSSILIPDLHVNIPVFSLPDPKLIPWKNVETEVILECTGRFLSTELASQHLNDNIKKIILSAPAKDINIPTVVIGVNHDNLNSIEVNKQKIISNASCTTNCISPALKVLNDNYTIQNILALTAHAYTATQFLQDSPSKKEFRDGRAAAINAIPSTTGAAKAVELVIPSLKGKINLSSLRIPVISGSYIYLVVNFEDYTPTKDEVNKLFKTQSQENLKDILEYSQQNLVSSDIIGNPHSCVIDAHLTEVNGKSAKIVLWYDNEWGYANRLVELIKLI